MFLCFSLSPADQCIVTRSYLFLHKFWFFSTIYYFGNWAFIGVSPRMRRKCHRLYKQGQILSTVSFLCVWAVKKSSHRLEILLILLAAINNETVKIVILYLWCNKTFTETTSIKHLIQFKSSSRVFALGTSARAEAHNLISTQKKVTGK